MTGEPASPRSRASRRSRGSAARCGAGARRWEGIVRRRPRRRAGGDCSRTSPPRAPSHPGSGRRAQAPPAGKKASRQVRIGQCGSVRSWSAPHSRADVEGVVVVAEPDMEAVLLDTAMGSSARRPFPRRGVEATFEHRDRGEALGPPGLGEPPRRGQAGHPPPRMRTRGAPVMCASECGRAVPGPR